MKEKIANELKITDRKRQDSFKKRTYKIMVNDTDFLLKEKEPNKLRFKTMINDTLKLETIVYLELHTKKFRDFNIPKLVDYDENNFLITEFLDNTNDYNHSDNQDQKLANSLYELNTSNIDLNLSVINKIYIKVFRTVYSILFRNGLALLIKNKLKFNNMLKIIRIMSKEFLKQPVIKKIVLHNDLLGPNNILYKRNKNKIYFIDFESVSFEKKWVLKDIIQLSLEKEIKSI